MSKERILQLIKKHETQRVEFTSRPSEEIGNSICSFANTNDGMILVGVSNEGEIIGCSKKMEQQIANIAHSCKPSIYPEIEETKVDGKTIFIVKVKKSGSIHSHRNVAYKRVGTHDKPLSPEEVIEFAKSIGKISFDSQICESASLKHINKEDVKKFLREARTKRGLDLDENLPIEEILMRLKLTRNKKLTNAAVLLFGNPQDFFLQCEVKCIRFKGTDVTGKMIDLKPIGDNIIDQVIEAEKFIFDHIAMSTWIESGKIKRQEKWEYPPRAIREALSNAIAHRDYWSTAKVQVRIFDDRIEFWNPGRLPEGWTVETLKQKHDSIPPNPLIARQFFWIKYIEEVGTGTNKIIEWCSDWGLPEPDFEYTGTSLVVTLRKSKLTEEYLKTLDFNDRQKKAIEFIREHERITSKEYAKLFGVTDRTARNDLRDLINKKVMKRVGTSDKTSYYILAEI